jgi:hypothetical protein
VFDFVEISEKYFLKSSMATITQGFYRLFSNWLHRNKGIAKARNIRDVILNFTFAIWLKVER